MTATLRFVAILVADLRERTRTPRFWVMLGLVLLCTWYCFPPKDAGYLILATSYGRGTYSSAWIGMVLGLVLGNIVGLVGFYLVRGTLVRDFDTRVWQLLVATPMTRGGFLLAKWLSHMVIFSLIIALALLVGLIAQWVRGEDPNFELFELVKPVLLLSMPSLAITAMFAVWFDLIPWLRRTLGNVLYFILWIIILTTSVAPLQHAGPSEHAHWRSDPGGMVMVARDFNRVHIAQTGVDPGFGFSLGSSDRNSDNPLFEWAQWRPRPMDMLGRMLWLLISIAGVLAAAPLLDWSAARTSGSGQRHASGSGRTMAWLNRLARPFESSPTGILVFAELKFVLRQRRAWWWFAALALAVTQIFVTGDALNVALCLAWVLPLDILARSALRESDGGTTALIFTAPGIVWRLLSVRVLVGLLICVLLVLPAIAKLLLVSPASAAAILAICASIVFWGLALGLLCRNPRPFELLVLIVAYAGLNKSSLVDVLHYPQSTGGGHLLAVIPALIAIGWLWPTLAHSHSRGH